MSPLQHASSYQLLFYFIRPSIFGIDILLFPRGPLRSGGHITWSTPSSRRVSPSLAIFCNSLTQSSVLHAFFDNSSHSFSVCFMLIAVYSPIFSSTYQATYTRHVKRQDHNTYLPLCVSEWSPIYGSSDWCRVRSPGDRRRGLCHPLCWSSPTGRKIMCGSF